MKRKVKSFKNQTVFLSELCAVSKLQQMFKLLS